MQRRTNQGGSIVAFIVIGAILFVVLIGSVYALNKHSEQVRKDQTIAANEKQQTEKNADKSNNSSNSSTAKLSNNKTSTNSSEATSNSKKLPASGTELSAIKLISIYLLASITTAYIISLRKTKHSL